VFSSSRVYKFHQAHVVCSLKYTGVDILRLVLRAAIAVLELELELELELVQTHKPMWHKSHACSW
jgi:hypothetical protein